MRLLRAVDRHWFEPARVSDLALARILIVGSQLLFFLPELDDQLWLAAADPSLFRPIPALKVLMVPFGEWGLRPEPMFLQAVWGAAVVSGIAGLVGLYTRASLLVFAATNTLLVAHLYSYSEYHHPEALTAIALWLLALAPSGAAYSLDDLRTRLAGAVRFMRFEPRRPTEDYSPMARWPLRTIQWLFVLVYFSAAISKLTRGGLEWFNGHTLSFYVLQDGIRWGSPIAIPLAEQVWLMTPLSVGAVVFEISFVLAVLVPVLAWPYVLTGAAMHTGIWVIQRAPFFQYLFLYVAFIESLRRYAPGWLKPRSGRPKWHVIYDGLCPRCIRSMVVLDYLDTTDRLRCIDLESEWDRASRAAPGVTREAARHSMQVVSPGGRVHSGYFGFKALARTLPALWLVLPLFYLPLADRLGPRIYDRLAATRLRIGCTAESCGVPRGTEAELAGVAAGSPPGAEPWQQ